MLARFFLSFLTVRQDALVSRSLEGPDGCGTFTLCCDGLDLQPVQAGRVQACHHQNITILEERKKRKTKFQMLKVCEIVRKPLN